MIDLLLTQILLPQDCENNVWWLWQFFVNGWACKRKQAEIVKNAQGYTQGKKSKIAALLSFVKSLYEWICQTKRIKYFIKLKVIKSLSFYYHCHHVIIADFWKGVVR